MCCVVCDEDDDVDARDDDDTDDDNDDYCEGMTLEFSPLTESRTVLYSWTLILCINEEVTIRINEA